VVKNQGRFGFLPGGRSYLRGEILFSPKFKGGGETKKGGILNPRPGWVIKGGWRTLANFGRLYFGTGGFYYQNCSPPLIGQDLARIITRAFF